jgi:uncharacterized protein
MQLRIKVVPGARNEGLEWLGDLLKVKVRAAPEKGRANAAVETLLAQRLALPPSSVRIVAGFGSPLKTVDISAIADLPALRQKLQLPC